MHPIVNFLRGLFCGSQSRKHDRREVRVINFDEGWKTIQGGIDKMISFVDAGGLEKGECRYQLTAADYMYIYDAVFMLYIHKPSYDKELYNRYEAFFQNYVHYKILPAVREKSGEPLLREVVKQWKNYKFIARLMSRFFQHFDQFFIYRYRTPTMHNIALLILQNQVYEQLKEKIIGSVLSMIHEDREGNSSIDRAFIKEALAIVYDLHSKTINVPYQIDFEPAFFDSTCAYYLTKMDNSPQNLPQLEHMSQASKCINDEKFRAMQYLPPSTLNKLLELLNLKLGIKRSSDAIC